MASGFKPTRLATRFGGKRGGKQYGDEMWRGDGRGGSGMSSYSVSHVMDCVAVSSGIRYEMRTGRIRDDGVVNTRWRRYGKQETVSMTTFDDIENCF